VEKNTRKMLRRLFSPELSRRSNFTGKEDKIAFKNLTLLEIIKSKIKLITSIKQCKLNVTLKINKLGFLEIKN
jgi:hypothetical protein